MLSYVNRKLVTYYPHLRRTSSGREVYVMTRTSDGALEQLPPGMEIVENVNAQVSVRMRRPRNITADEESQVRTALNRLELKHYRLEVKDREIIICEPRYDTDNVVNSLYDYFNADTLRSMVLEQARAKAGDHSTNAYLQQRREEARAALQRDQDYEPVLKFTLSRQSGRCFTVERMKYTGEGGWRFVNVVTLEEAVCKYLPTLGKESFFEM